jgi:hypothetical protein
MDEYIFAEEKHLCWQIHPASNPTS